MVPILEIKNISKKFRIRHEQQPYLSLRDSLTSVFKNPFHQPSTINHQPSSEAFWALKDVSFDVYPGESIGIIGKNGAGKSTLLKILSKITPPSEGKIISRGRIASLLEVGTGFHPELTGRENIFLNGSILGMKRKEIQNKFDEIVDFSGVEKFLDTPLKHYSSGMQLRLAFAVAAFLEPEILLIDEVLAVGDTFFQMKCIDKMLGISKSGKTILFVSHNFSSIRAICKKGIVLESGKIHFEGEIESAISTYNSNSQLRGKNIDLLSIKREKFKKELIFSTISFVSNNLICGEKIIFSVLLHRNIIRTYSDLDFGVYISDKNNTVLIHLSNRFINKKFNLKESDSTEFKMHVDNILKPGFYNLSLFLREGDDIQDWLTDVLEIKVEDSNPYQFNDVKSIHGLIFPNFHISHINSQPL